VEEFFGVVGVVDVGAVVASVQARRPVSVTVVW
jgi:hypothetical protein